MLLSWVQHLTDVSVKAAPRLPRLPPWGAAPPPAPSAPPRGALPHPQRSRRRPEGLPALNVLQAAF